jgi:hypothetical protein
LGRQAEYADTRKKGENIRRENLVDKRPSESDPEMFAGLGLRLCRLVKVYNNDFCERKDRRQTYEYIPVNRDNAGSMLGKTYLDEVAAIESSKPATPHLENSRSGV